MTVTTNNNSSEKGNGGDPEKGAPPSNNSLLNVNTSNNNGYHAAVGANNDENKMSPNYEDNIERLWISPEQNVVFSWDESEVEEVDKNNDRNNDENKNDDSNNGNADDKNKDDGNSNVNDKDTNNDKSDKSNDDDKNKKDGGDDDDNDNASKKNYDIEKLDNEEGGGGRIDGNDTNKNNNDGDDDDRSNNNNNHSNSRFCLINWFVHWPGRNPRSFAFLFGILLPLWLIVGISIGFGEVLGQWESPTEISYNDAVLADKYMFTAMDQAIKNAFVQLPEVCFEYYLYNNITTKDDVEKAKEKLFEFVNETIDELEIDVDDRSGRIYEGITWLVITNETNDEDELPIDIVKRVFLYRLGVEINNNDDIHLINTTELKEWMTTCSTILSPIVDIITRQLRDSVWVHDDLSFNWIRCVNTTEVGERRWFSPSPQLMNASKPENQAQYYFDIWHEDQQYLYNKYLNEIIGNVTSLNSTTTDTTTNTTNTTIGNRTIISNITEANLNNSTNGTNITSFNVRNASNATTELENYEQNEIDKFILTLTARAKALNRSLEEATGGSGCRINTISSSWFWFTVMTTVGYGNQAPVTDNGRLLVTTVGFLAILTFAGILGSAGSITITIVDDAIMRISRKRLRFLTWPWVGCILYGTAWYCWMFLIGEYYRDWTRKRLGDTSLSRTDSYWFAWISTTTVGLGDEYPSPEVLFGGDLFSFSFLFLVGFMFISCFFGKTTQLVGVFFPDSTAKLERKLQKTSPKLNLGLSSKRIANRSSKNNNNSNNRDDNDAEGIRGEEEDEGGKETMEVFDSTVDGYQLHVQDITENVAQYSHEEKEETHVLNAGILDD